MKRVERTSRRYFFYFNNVVILLVLLSMSFYHHHLGLWDLSLEGIPRIGVTLCKKQVWSNVDKISVDDNVSRLGTRRGPENRHFSSPYSIFHP